MARSATAQPAVFGSTSVSGPGQNASASAIAVASKRRDLPGGSEVADMGDQRIEGRPALGLVEPRDRRRIGGVGAEPVDGLGRERDQPALGQARAAAATAASPAGKICVFRPTFTGINFLNSASCGARNPRL